MTKEQAIEKLVDQINSDMAIFVGILAIVLAAFLYFQWRLSDKQIKKMKDETRQELEETYHFNEMRRDINGLVDYRMKLATQLVVNKKRHSA